MEVTIYSLSPTLFIFMIFSLAILAFYFYCLYHALTNGAIPSTNRLLWFLIILSIPLLGSIAYWTMGRVMKAPSR